MSEVFAAIIASIVAFVTGVLSDTSLPQIVPSEAVPQVTVTASPEVDTKTSLHAEAKQTPKKGKPAQPKPVPQTPQAEQPVTVPEESVSPPVPDPEMVATFEDLGGTTRVLTNGNATLARFMVTAGDVAFSIDRLKLTLTRYGGVEVRNVRVFAFSDEFRSPVVSHPDGKLFSSTELYRSESGLVHTSDIDVSFATPLLVPAAEARYVLVLAEIARVEDHPDYVTASVHGVDGVKGTTKWWMTYNGEPTSTTGGYDLSQQASVAIVFDALRSWFLKITSRLQW